MVFPSLVVFGFITKPPTMIRLFAELSGHYQMRFCRKRNERLLVPRPMLTPMPSAGPRVRWRKQAKPAIRRVCLPGRRKMRNRFDQPHTLLKKELLDEVTSS
jgi:hypothetical protein